MNTLKKTSLIIVSLLITSILYSQSYKEEVDLFQAVFGMEKKAVVAEFVTPSPEQADAFCALYDEYEIKRKELGKERMELLLEYALKFEQMNATEADAWTQKIIALQKNTDKLLNTYYGKVRKI